MPCGRSRASARPAASSLRALQPLGRPLAGRAGAGDDAGRRISRSDGTVGELQFDLLVARGSNIDDALLGTVSCRWTLSSQRVVTRAFRGAAAKARDVGIFAVLPLRVPKGLPPPSAHRDVTRSQYDQAGGLIGEKRGDHRLANAQQCHDVPRRAVAQRHPDDPWRCTMQEGELSATVVLRDDGVSARVRVRPDGEIVFLRLTRRTMVDPAWKRRCQQLRQARAQLVVEAQRRHDA